MKPLDRQLITLISNLAEAAKRSYQRRLLVLSGEQEWAQQLALALQRGTAFTEDLSDREWFRAPLWIGEQVPGDGPCLSPQQARQILGSEVDLLIYDAWQGTDPDALAAAAGALCGGGLLVLLIPPLQDWPGFADPDYQRLLVHPYDITDIKGFFLQQLASSVASARQALVIEQDKALPAQTVDEASEFQPQQVTGDGCRSDDQSQAVQAIIRVFTGHRRRPLVITSDRGRGKSAALGIASAQLLSQASKRDALRIVVTAPRVESVQSLFEQAAATLGLSCPVPLTAASAKLKGPYGSLRFLPPDEILRESVALDLLLVDEAAAISVSLLSQLLERYSRIVFATTVHGYEGTGRGFAIRFKQCLQQLTPQWQAMELRAPMRWAEDDPVERWLYDALLLDVQAASDSLVEEATAGRCVVEQISSRELLEQCDTLQQLFGLLVLAHYQTSPADLRNLLDGPNINVWISRYQGNVVAAALVAEEGGFDRELSLAIWKGERRPRGHLLAQTLSAHQGLKEAPELRYQRIMRIAVHPRLQQRGLGRQLLQAIISQARTDKFDLMGSSFAATADVLAFWRKNQCVTVRLGVSRDASSGCHSAVILSALSAEGEQLLVQARQRFSEQFTFSLATLYQQLEPVLVAELLLGTEREQASLNQQDWLDIEAFCRGHRQPEMCLLPLCKLVCLGLSREDVRRPLSLEQRALLIMRVLQYRPTAAVIEPLRLTGKKQMLLALREAVSTIAGQLEPEFNRVER